MIPSTNPGMKHAVANARAALARYDASLSNESSGNSGQLEPPTSRGSEGEAIRICAKFGARVFDAFFGDGRDIGDLDGSDLQDIGVDSGLLVEHVIETDAGCGEDCNCIGNGAGAGDTCFRPTVKRDVRDEIMELDTAPPPSHPSPEAWRQATIECRSVMAGSLCGPESICDWIATRAAEIHAASCAKEKE